MRKGIMWSKHQLAVISHFNNYVLHFTFTFTLCPFQSSTKVLSPAIDLIPKAKQSKTQN